MYILYKPNTAHSLALIHSSLHLNNYQITDELEIWNNGASNDL